MSLNKNRLIIEDCHDCIDWGPGEKYCDGGTRCGALAPDYPIVPDDPNNCEITPIPDWCPRLAKQRKEIEDQNKAFNGICEITGTGIFLWNKTKERTEYTDSDQYKNRDSSDIYANIADISHEYFN